MEDIEIREESNSQFTIQALIKEIKNNVLLIIAITLLFAAIGGVVGKFFIKTTYVSKASLMVATSTEGENAITQSKELASTIKAFLDSTNNTIFTATEIEYNSMHPHQKLTTKEIAKSLDISVNTIMIDLTYTTTNKDAKIILQKIVENIITAVNEVNPDTNEPTYSEFAGKLKETSPASNQESDEGTKVFKYMIIFFIIGAFGSLLFVFFKVILNDTYSDKESLELDVGIDVLSMIEISASSNTKEEK
jgi:capsular polysaccharide biosynthesis protein